MTEDLLSRHKAQAPIWQYLGYRPSVNREPDDVNEGKEVGNLAEKLKVFCLSLAALNPTAHSCSITPTDYIKLLPVIFQTDPLSTDAENGGCFASLDAFLINDSTKMLNSLNTWHFLGLAYFLIKVNLCVHQLKAFNAKLQW